MNSYQPLAEITRSLDAAALGMDLIDIGMAHIDLSDSLTILSCNNYMKKIADQYDLTTHSLQEWLTRSDYDSADRIRNKLSDSSHFIFENEGRSATGKVINFQWAISQLNESTLLCFVRDIRWRQKHKDQWTLFDRIINSSHSSVVVTDASNRIVIANKRFEEISGYSAYEVLGMDPGHFGSDRQNKAFYQSLWHSLNQDGFWSGLIWNRRKDGREYPEQKTIYSVKNEHGQVTHYFSSGKPVLYNDHLSFSSSLPSAQNNSILVQDDFVKQLSALLVKNNRPAAVFYLGIDNMSKLNRYGGMALGDHVLRETLERLQDTFSPSGLICRSVGDEFIVAAPYINGPSQALTVADALLHTLQQSIRYQSIELKLTVSIGIDFIHKASQVRKGVELAHIAMHHAKDLGGNCVQFFDSQIQKQTKENVHLEYALTHALENREFYLQYQPLIDAESRNMVGAEALIRWNSKRFGFVPPDRFIPMAEHSGVIHDIGRWVVEEVCRQLQEWGDDFSGAVAVNLSAHQLQYAGLSQQLLSILDRYNIPVERIHLEITETAMIQDAQSAISVVNDLKTVGFLLSIDDFGTGYSSLSYLTEFHLDKLKIDRSFVNKMLYSQKEETITRAIIQLAKNLDIKVVAEGVETEEQNQVLIKLGCDYLQGYLISKPLAAPEFIALKKQLTFPATTLS